MIGYYQSQTSEEIYHVYGKGFEFFAQCVKSKVKPQNQPFKIEQKHIETYLKRGSWVQIEKPQI